MNIPNVAIPIVSVPPDINGGKLFSLGQNQDFLGQQFCSGGARHDYDLAMVNKATLNQAPFANFTATPISGTPPLAVSFNAGAVGGSRRHDRRLQLELR